MWVAVHEIDRALGLDHSDSFDPVLEATLNASQSFTQLPADDVDAILELYAAQTPSAKDFDFDSEKSLDHSFELTPDWEQDLQCSSAAVDVVFADFMKQIA